MKVAFVTALYPTASDPAAGAFVRDQAIALATHGSRVDVLHVHLRSPRAIGRSASHPVTAEPETGDESPEIHLWEGWSLGSRSVPAVSRHGARRLLARYRPAEPPDVIHGHFCIDGGAAAAVVAARLRRPLVITEHSTDFARGRVVGWRRAAIRRSALAADVVVAVSEPLADSLERLTGRRPIVVPNVVDVEWFRPRAGSRLDGPFHIVSVGSLKAKKGFDLLLEALSLLPRDDWRATIAGEGRERAHLVALARALGVANRVDMPGGLRRGEVAAILQGADVFVSSSRSETFGVAVAEALAAGVPVVTTRSGGPETFVGAGSGIVVNAVPAEIAGAIDDVMQGMLAFDPAAAHEGIARAFGPTAFTERLLAVYAQAGAR